MVHFKPARIIFLALACVGTFATGAQKSEVTFDVIDPEGTIANSADVLQNDVRRRLKKKVRYYVDLTKITDEQLSFPAFGFIRHCYKRIPFSHSAILPYFRQSIS